MQCYSQDLLHKWFKDRWTFQCTNLTPQQVLWETQQIGIRCVMKCTGLARCAVSSGEDMCGAIVLGKSRLVYREVVVRDVNRHLQVTGVWGKVIMWGVGRCTHAGDRALFAKVGLEVLGQVVAAHKALQALSTLEALFPCSEKQGRGEKAEPSRCASHICRNSLPQLWLSLPSRTSTCK